MTGTHRGAVRGSTPNAGRRGLRRIRLLLPLAAAFVLGSGGVAAAGFTPLPPYTVPAGCGSFSGTQLVPGLWRIDDHSGDTVGLGSVGSFHQGPVASTGGGGIPSNPLAATLIIGTPFDDYIQGNGPTDVICGLGGRDMIFGGDGDDHLYGDGDVDALDGEDGADFLAGGPGIDTLFGDDPTQSHSTDGADTLDGGDGGDFLFGAASGDTLNGGNGDDSLYGDGDADVLSGDNGTDYLAGGSGSDTLFGDDLAQSHSADGADTLDGGGDNDFLYGGAAVDTIDGGSGASDYADGQVDGATCTLTEAGPC